MPELRHLFLASALLATAACGKKAAGDGAHDCDDVEAAMRRIDPDRTADIKAGTFAKVCKQKPDEFTQARIDCTVAAKNYDDLKVCADSSKAPVKPAEGATAELAWRDVPKFGAKLHVPGNVTVDLRTCEASGHESSCGVCTDLCHGDLARLLIQTIRRTRSIALVRGAHRGRAQTLTPQG